jgi:transcriptional regulator with XRE-family HTH domain
MLPGRQVWYNSIQIAKRGVMVRLRVKEIARKKGISMGKLSRASDISYRTIQRIYNDSSYIPTIPTLEKIAKVLGVSTGDLIEDTQDVSTL